MAKSLAERTFGERIIIKNLEQFARKITVRLAGLPKVLGKKIKMSQIDSKGHK